MNGQIREIPPGISTHITKNRMRAAQSRHTFHIVQAWYPYYDTIYLHFRQSFLNDSNPVIIA